MSEAAGAQRDGHTPTHTYRPHQTRAHSVHRRANKQEEGSLTQCKRCTYIVVLYHWVSQSLVRDGSQVFINSSGISCLTDEYLQEYRSRPINNTFTWFPVTLKSKADWSSVLASIHALIVRCWGTITVYGWIVYRKLHEILPLGNPDGIACW